MYLENKVTIEDGKKIQCQRCTAIVAIINDHEVFLRKVVASYYNKEKKIVEVKCQFCKTVTEIKIP